MRSVAQQLREQGKEQPAKLAEQAAERADQLADYLKRADGDSILRDAEDFGRRQPWAVMFGGLAAGFLASRFLKASSSRRADIAPSSYNRSGATYGVPQGTYPQPRATFDQRGANGERTGTYAAPGGAHDEPGGRYDEPRAVPPVEPLIGETGSAEYPRPPRDAV